MKKIKLIFSLLTLSLLSVSCIVDDDVESNASTTYVYGFTQSARSLSYENSGDIVDVTVPVIFLSSPNGLTSGAATTITYEVDTVNSTAVEGTEFDFSSPSRTVTIAPGSTTVNIPLKINTGALVPGAENATKIVLKLTNLTSDSGGLLSANFSTLTITLNGLCFSDLEGEYFWNYTTGPAYFDVVRIGPGLYSGGQFPFFVAIYEFEFSDVCGTLTMTDWDFMAGNPLFGTTTPLPTGTVLPNGDLIFTGINVTGTTVLDRTITAYKVQ